MAQDRAEALATIAIETGHGLVGAVSHVLLALIAKLEAKGVLDRADLLALSQDFQEAAAQTPDAPARLGSFKTVLGALGEALHEQTVSRGSPSRLQ
jgi:hypothetical protein